MTVVLPPSRVAIAGNAPPSREWYRFFQDSLQVNLDVDSLQERVDDLTVRVTALEDAPASSTPTRIIGYGSIYVSATAIKTVTLDGDAEDPGFTTYYGTDTTGEKGWYAVAATLADSSNVVKSTDAAGVTSFDLTDVTVASTGGTLDKRSFDAKGRLSAEASATTTDLTEGTNLYYTDARADARITLQKGIANGLAPLGGDAKINVSYLPAAVLGQVSYQGTWDASAGTAPTTVPEKGWYYIVTVAGSTDLDGIMDWKVGDWAIYNGSSWDKVDNTDAISTWNGRTGAVVPQAGDYSKADVGLGNVDNTSDADKPVSAAQAASLALKQDISGLGTAAFVNTGNNNVGLAPLLSVNAGQTTLELTGVTGRVAFAGTTAETDGDGKPVMHFNGKGGPSVSGGAEQRVGIFALNTNGPTATKRGGAFIVLLKQDNSDSIVGRFNINYLGHATPGVDNAQDVGSSALRWSVVYAGTGTINTSDAREKTTVEPLTSDELAAAADLSRAIGTYQWLAMIAEKGADKARHHAGLTVQRAIEIMESHGLEPMRYGFICYDQWDETPEVCDTETGEVTQADRPAGDRYSFRTDELLLFIARGVSARLDALEAAAA